MPSAIALAILCWPRLEARNAPSVRFVANPVSTRMAGRRAVVSTVKPACCTPRSPPGWIRAAESWTSWASCADSRRYRSEEHTSELQSHSDLVCRLLLEKKKSEHEARARLRLGLAVLYIGRAGCKS